MYFIEMQINSNFENHHYNYFPGAQTEYLGKSIYKEINFFKGNSIEMQLG